MTQYLVSDAAKICGTSSLHTVPVPQCLLAKTASRPRSRRLPVPYADETNFEKCSEFFFVFFQKKKKNTIRICIVKSKCFQSEEEGRHVPEGSRASPPAGAPAAPAACLTGCRGAGAAAGGWRRPAGGGGCSGDP